MVSARKWWTVLDFFELTGIDVSKAAPCHTIRPMCPWVSNEVTAKQNANEGAPRTQEAVARWEMQQNNRPDWGANDEVSNSRQSDWLRDRMAPHLHPGRRVAAPQVRKWFWPALRDAHHIRLRSCLAGGLTTLEQLPLWFQHCFTLSCHSRRKIKARDVWQCLDVVKK